MTGGAQDALVRVDNLTRSFMMEDRMVHALDDVSLDIGRGQALAVIGASGAGKSTLLQLLGALDKPTSGRVLFDGRDIFALNEKELATFRSRSVGFVFQAGNLLPEFTAEENVALAAMIAGEARPAAIGKARKLLDSVGLSERLRHRPGKLSGGEQQRVAIARALVNEPVLVLADEPTGNLDTHTGDDILNLIMELNTRRNQTFVIVTHNMALAKRMSRIVRIKDGKFVDSLDDMLE